MAKMQREEIFDESEIENTYKEDTPKTEEEKRAEFLESLPTPHKLFYAVFEQSKEDIQKSIPKIDSFDPESLKNRNAKTNFKDMVVNIAESVVFFSNHDGHFGMMAENCNIDPELPALVSERNKWMDMGKEALKKCASLNLEFNDIKDLISQSIAMAGECTAPRVMARMRR